MLDRLSVDEKKRLIELDNKGLSVRRQCELVGLNRSNLYYEPVAVTDETVRFTHRVDEIFANVHFMGVAEYKRH